MKVSTSKQIVFLLEQIQLNKDLLQEILDDLQNQFDEKSELWQESEKGEAFQSEIDSLEEIIGNLEYCTPDDIHRGCV